MKISPREMNLLGMTLAVLLLAGTYWALGDKFTEWKDFSRQREEFDDRLFESERLVASRDRVEEELEQFSTGLPVIMVGRRADTELLPALDRLTKNHGLVLTRRTAGAEREAQELYETTINCEWQGSLEALVGFLYAQQEQGVVSDIQQLSIQPATGQGAAGQLKGTFAMDHAYRRGDPAAEAASAGTGGPLAVEGESN